MNRSIWEYFSVSEERISSNDVHSNISDSVSFRGTNLWILIFAIFVASLGLNVNSAAVIIGAMLISPLMGPIMGIGFGAAIFDLPLIRKSALNYLFAIVAGLITSTIYFSFSPLNEAHSEILARTAPNIYDVLIAFFGGLAGMLATASKQKGNVLPGVAIATALMPPLCTAGYGIATLKPEFFLGALYLFFINTVFIAFASFLIVKILRYPYREMPDEETRKKTYIYIWVIVVVTILPSMYLGYRLVQKNNFINNAHSFIDKEAHFPDEYLLEKTIDPAAKSITLVFGGKKLDDKYIQHMDSARAKYGLRDAKLLVKQGFAYLSDIKKDESSKTDQALLARDIEILKLKEQIDSLKTDTALSLHVYKEMKAMYPDIRYFVLQPVHVISDSGTHARIYLSLISLDKRHREVDRKVMNDWLKARLEADSVLMIIE